METEMSEPVSSQPAKKTARAPKAAAKPGKPAKPAGAAAPKASGKAAAASKPRAAQPKAPGAKPAAAGKAKAEPVVAEKAKRAKKQKVEKVEKVEKAGKVVRDSFTMPRADYAKIAALKQRCLDGGVAVKKSELLRAGLLLLDSATPEQLLEAVRAVETVKTGRPEKA
jgi:hypothetical protein